MLEEVGLYSRGSRQGVRETLGSFALGAKAEARRWPGWASAGFGPVLCVAAKFRLKAEDSRNGFEKQVFEVLFWAL